MMKDCQSTRQNCSENGEESVRFLLRFALLQLLTFKNTSIMIHLALLALMTTSNVDGKNITLEEAEQIISLNEVKTLQIFGDIITIVAKNDTNPDNKTCGDFESYLQNHLIRIKSPIQEEKYLDFELNDLIPDNETEGREKRDKRKGPIREILIPLLLALKYKSTVVLPLLMMMITFVAFKGFWAGMTGLVISKVVGLKVLLQSLKKGDEDHDESEDNDNVFYDFPQQSEDENRRSDKPLVIYLQSYNKRRKFPKRHEKSITDRHLNRGSRKNQQSHRRAEWISQP